MEKVDFAYELSDERLRAYTALSVYDKLRWLDSIVRFTALMRTAETVRFGASAIDPDTTPALRATPPQGGGE